MFPAFKYGLLSAAATAAWLLGSYALGLHTHHLALARYTDVGPHVILVFMLWRMLRFELYDRNRSWLPVWQGLLHGLITALVAAMGAYIALSCYLMFVNSEYFDLQLEQQVATLRAHRVPEDEVRTFARGFRERTGPLGLPFMLGRVYLLTAFIASPLLTLWLDWRRKESPIVR